MVAEQSLQKNVVFSAFDRDFPELSAVLQN